MMGDNEKRAGLAFWASKALRYPRPFDPETERQNRELFSLVESRGVSFAAATILDVGCGTGVHSLALARRAAHVVGLDSSAAMLDIFERERVAAGIENAQSWLVSWKELDIDAVGLAKAYDIAWASMTPAVSTVEDLSKLQHCARRWCVYIGWGRVRRNVFWQDLYARHGLEFGPPPGVAAIQALLREQGREVAVDYLESEWEWVGTVAEAAAEARLALEHAGARPCSETIAAVVAAHARNGEVRHCTLAEKGVMVWPVS